MVWEQFQTILPRNEKLNIMYIHAYDKELNYLGIKEVDIASIKVQNEFEKELLRKYPNSTINFDVEPTDKELYRPIEKGDDDLPF